MTDAYLDTCEDRVREIERIAGDCGITRPQLDRLSIDWYGQEPYKLPLTTLNTLLRLMKETRDALA